MMSVIAKCLIDRSEEAAISGMESGVLACCFLMEQAPKAADPDVVRFLVDVSDSAAIANSVEAVAIVCRSEEPCLIHRMGSKGGDGLLARFEEDALSGQALRYEA